MSNTTTPDYTKQLKDALNVTRQEMLTQIDAALGEREVALQAREIAHHDRSVASIANRRTQDVRNVLAKIEELTTLSTFTVGNLVKAADLSTATAATEVSSMATAAASIKEAGASLEALMKSAYGITALVHRNDKGDEIDKTAKAAAEKLKRAVDSVNKLRSASLDSSIVSAKSIASAVSQTFALVKTQIEGMDAEATAALSRANELAQAALDQHNKSSEFFFTQTSPFDTATGKRDSLRWALERLDQATEGGPTVECTNDPGLKVIKAAHETEPKDASLGAAYIAVEKHLVPYFKPTHAIQGTKADNVLLEDHTGEAIAFGKSYCVFEVLNRKDSTNDLPRISLPSIPVLVQWTWKEPVEKPTVIPLEADGFLVTMDLKQIQHDISISATKRGRKPVVSELRLFIVPVSQWLSDRADDQFLADWATAASYLSLDPDDALKANEADAMAQSVIKLNREDAASAKIFSLPETAWSAKKKELATKLQTGAIAAYFSPYAMQSERPLSKNGRAKFLVGAYADAFGDPIDFTRSEYLAVALVLLKDQGTDEESRIQSAEMILSNTAPIQKPSPLETKEEKKPTAQR